MAQDDEECIIQSESNADVNTIVISELPRRSFSLTLEIPLFLIILGVSLSGAAINNILLYRTCIHSLNHSENECKIFLVPDKTNTTKNLEEEVQKYVTFVSTLRTIIESVVPAGLSFFLGVWSDTHGRRPLIVWPLFGISFSGMLTVIYSMLNNLGPWWFILCAIPMSLTGGFIVLMTGAFCYVSDVTSTESRSLRMTMVNASISLGSFSGLIVSSHLLRAVGNVYLLLIVAAVFVAAYAFTSIFLKESLTGTIKGNLCSVINFLLVKEMVRECFKKRLNRGRAQILLLMFANSTTILIIYGSNSLDYYYAREKLHWSLSDYNTYSAVNTVISFIGGFLGILVLQKFLRVTDLALAIIAFLSAAVEYVFKIIAVDYWYMYLGAFVSLLKNLSSPLIRSLLTKILPLEDIAKVFALMSSVEAMCPIIAPLMYNSLYYKTISVFPGAIYVLSIGLVFSSVIMLLFVQYYRWISANSPLR